MAEGKVLMDRLPHPEHRAADVRGAGRLPAARLPGRVLARRHRHLLRPPRHRARPAASRRCFQALPERIWGVMSNDTLLAVPFFTFMGLILERSGMAEDLLDTIGQLFGPLRGGLAFAVIFVGALLAATTGVVAASVISMGLISLPIMLRYGYDRRFASGVIAASGTLAQIIPPSLVLIIMADQLGKSVGDMYAGAFIPGLTLAGLYAVYALGVADLQARLGAGAAAGGAHAPRAQRLERAPLAAACWRCSRSSPPCAFDQYYYVPQYADAATRRAHRGRRPRSASASRSSRRWSTRLLQARPAVADRRARDLRADPAAGADLPRAGHDLPRRGDADRGRRDGRHRRAGHGARAPAPVASRCCSQAMDTTAKLSTFVVFILVGARVFSLTFYGVERPRLGRAPAHGPARRAARLPDRRQPPDLRARVLPRLLRARRSSSSR